MLKCFTEMRRIETLSALEFHRAALKNVSTYCAMASSFTLSEKDRSNRQFSMKRIHGSKLRNNCRRRVSIS